jgi:hypothetical protein
MASADMQMKKKIGQESQNGMKFGSIQQFAESEGPVENISPSLLSRDEVHKIAILDLRLLNLDRNTDNILYRVTTGIDKRTGQQRRVRKLIPIDHGLTIPDNLAIQSFDLAWLGWDQA